MHKYYIGIDSGSISTDGVLLDEFGDIKRWAVLPTGASIADSSELCYEELLKGLPLQPKDIHDDVYVVSTGYGHRRVKHSSLPITEITAHALGAGFLFPNASTIVDMGGQDTKVILLDSKGNVSDFLMNDKCAAGTGRFLEVMAGILQTDIEGMAESAVSSSGFASITSTCTVFIESEIISLISQGKSIGEITAGVFESITSRIISMIKSLDGKPPYVLTGGVAKNKAMVHFLKGALSGEILLPPEPQITGALGAAVFGLRKKKI